MKHFGIHHPELFQIEEHDRSISYGCQQRFFGTKWKQLSGCGPTAASNLVLYAQTKDVCTQALRIESIKHLMNGMWTYVTPGMMGVDSTTKFEKGLSRYLKVHELPYTVHKLDVPKVKEQRPTLQQVNDFLTQAFEKDAVVAFLNLHKGETENLDEWHWVVIIDVQYDESTSEVTILDDGKKLKVDLVVWLETTKNKGGFVSLKNIKES